MAGNESARSSTKLVKILILLGVLLAGAFLYWTFFLDPLLAGIDRAWDDQERLAGQIEVLERKLERKDAVEEEWLSLREDLERLAELIPDLDVLADVLGTLEQMIGDARLSIGSLRAGEITMLGQHASITLDMSVSGSDSAILTFLSDLEEFVHRVVIDNVSWSRSGSDSQLSLKFNLVLLPEG